MATNTNTMLTLQQKGKKLSFADRIANLSPTETPFQSMIGSKSIKQTVHQWQTDKLDTARAVDHVGFKEGSIADAEAAIPTVEKMNRVQMFRRVASVSDTANATDNYGRIREIAYQMDKAGKEMKRDVEVALLQNGDAVEEGSAARKMAGYKSLINTKGADDGDTGAVVHFDAANASSNTDFWFDEADIFKMTYNLYLAGSEADVIMVHPSLMGMFASLVESGSGRQHNFSGGETRFSLYVNEIRDPLGRVYRVIPNRFMPVDAIYFFNAKDFTKATLRPATRTKLAKDGSYEKFMIESELTLALRHPSAAGALTKKA